MNIREYSWRVYNKEGVIVARYCTERL